MPTVYPSLSIKAPQRLALFRAEAAKPPTWTHPMSWRNVRYATLKSHTGLDRGLNGGQPIWYTQEGPAFKREKFCDEVEYSRIRHNGWFCDEDANETARGIIVRLPHGRFLAGYYLSENDERVYFPELLYRENVAAEVANEHARNIAQREVEYRQKDRDAQACSESIETSLKRLRECLALRHKACMWYVKGEISLLLNTIRTNRLRLNTEFKGYL